ncbi:MAG: uroporphyrinogen-III synthase [Pseudomonadota bacterium]|nr:uroporphyrinogen-III synthase [Pseudomonadota bacterium]
MTHSFDAVQPLAGWYVISLRPSGGHAALRRAAVAQGAGLIALSPWRIQPLKDANTRSALEAALSADLIIVTSPSAVRATAALQPFDARGEQRFVAVGEGTAKALRRFGILDVETPARMDSEGVLALPALQAIDTHDIGLLTAPGGRNRIEPALRERGAHVLRAEVYRRVPIALSKQGVRALLELDGPAVLALSSGEAFVRVLDALPVEAVDVLRAGLVVAASDRLAGLAREHGFERVVIARSAVPHDLMAAAVKAASG